MSKNIPTSIPISPSAAKLLGTHERTEAEEKFLLVVLLTLDEMGFSGEINCRSFLANARGEFRRPDIFLPKFGISIEIDGNTREGWSHRQADMPKRDEFYLSLGLFPPIRIPSTSIASDLRVARFRQELKSYIEGWIKTESNYSSAQLTKAGRKKLAKVLNRGRKMMERQYPGIFSFNGTEAPQFSEELALRGFREFRHFGGTKLVLRGKYHKNPFTGFRLPRSPEEILAYSAELTSRFESRCAEALGNKKKC